ncbi:hypothetical protein EC957_008153 [Mortierella hygrophila]|uniref:ABC transporter domain-containing protein n=1 Tax=Mortierella hygrophila TaxID=979708 RepID=A0A9P6FIG9_9FUNG|nr:hypothetical protein EC957_008153 [Mortierella hygrophila]
MLTVLIAFAVQPGILIKVISDSDLYGGPSILSTVVYLGGLDQKKANADAEKSKKVMKPAAIFPIADAESTTRQFEKLDLIIAEKVIASETFSVTRDSMGPTMRDINLQARYGALTAVVSRVGERKSSIIGAILGEIFYGKERYLKTFRSCALVPNLTMLVSGDKTDINLSGGQKQRALIARAVYANADVYILDDPLSAVDAHVDHHIFIHALTTIPADKTCILSTNGVNHLKEVDQADGLHRTLEAAHGYIAIDGIEISTLGLHEPRSHLTIIPQEPILFGDAIRLNSDHFGKYTGAEIWFALEFASLKS